LLNSNFSAEARYATLVHELAHLYCGHLGTPNDKWWPDRRGLPHAAEEFEAESVCYLVCERLGIDNPSDEYLAGYLGSLDCVMKAAGLIERMGRERLGARKKKE
jgi:antirestriction protein ArdC